MHLLASCTQSGVLILGDVILDLQIPIHVFEVFSLLLFEDWALVSFANLLGRVIVGGNLLPFVLQVVGRDWISVSTTEQDVA